MKLSCILATNRDDGFLSKTIDSVLNQTHKEFELIIIANNCPTSIFDLIQSINDSRIKLIKSNLEDIAYARNLGIDNAGGELIAIIDSDDICREDRFQKQIEFMDQNPKIQVLSSWAEVIDKDDNKTGILTPRLPSNIKWLCVFKNPIINPSVTFRKSTWVKYKGFAGIPSSEDMGFWLKIASSGEEGFAILPEPLIKYRIHGNQTFRKKQPYVEACCFQFKLFLMGKGFRYLMGGMAYLVKAVIRGR